MIEEWLAAHDPQYSRIIVAAPTFAQAQYTQERLPRSTVRVTASTCRNYDQVLRGIHEKHVLILRYRPVYLCKKHQELLDCFTNATVIDVY